MAHYTPSKLACLLHSSVVASPPSLPRMCGPEPAPRGLWWDVRRCPSQSETDAIQIETDAILDMADLLVTSGLATAGYALLAVGSCATIQSPTIRAAIQAYIVQRGLSIVFAPHGAERQALSALPLHPPTAPYPPTSSHRRPSADHRPTPTPPPRSQTVRSLALSLYTADVDAASAQYARRPGAHLAPARPRNGTEDACLAESLSAYSGPDGWNDPVSLLPAPEALRPPAAARPPVGRLLARLRAAFSRRCLMGEALVLTPGLAALRDREPQLHAQAVRVLADELALAVHSHAANPNPNPNPDPNPYPTPTPNPLPLARCTATRLSPLRAAGRRRACSTTPRRRCCYRSRPSVLRANSRRPCAGRLGALERTR